MPSNIVLPAGLSFRVMEQGDESFVYSSFIKGNHGKGTLLGRHILPRQAHEALRAILRNVLAKSACVVLCDESNLDAIVGFVIFERSQRRVCVHYAYVKEGLRGLGYSNLLWQFATRDLHRDDTVWVSTLSPRARNIMDQKRIPWQFRPAMLFTTDTFKQFNTQDNIRHAKEEENPTYRYLSLSSGT